MTAHHTRRAPIPCPRFGDPSQELKDAAKRLQEAVGFTDRQAAALVAAEYRLLGYIELVTS